MKRRAAAPPRRRSPRQPGFPQRSAVSQPRSNVAAAPAAVPHFRGKPCLPVPNGSDRRASAIGAANIRRYSRLPAIDELGLLDESHGEQGHHNEDRPKKPTRDVRIKRCYYPSELVLSWRRLAEHNSLLRLIWVLRPITLNDTEWFHPEAPGNTPATPRTTRP